MANAIEQCWSRAWQKCEACDHPLARECKDVEIMGLKAWPSLDDITAFSRTTPTVCNSTGQKQSIAERIGNFIQTIHKFAPAFDVFVQQQPVLATIFWGSCRFLVQAVVSSIRLSAKVTSALLHILPSLGNISRESSFFTPGQPLLDSVVSYFTQIILFLALTRRHFGRSKVKRWLRAPFTNDIDDALETIHNSARAVAEELRIIALQTQTEEIREQARYRAESSSRLLRIEDSIVHSSQQQPTLLKDAGMVHLTLHGPSPHRLGIDASPETITKERVICWLDHAIYDPGVIHDAEPDTCCRIYQQEAWKTWVTQDYPHALLLTGVQGIGKTVHCKAIIARAAKEVQGVILSYFVGSTGGKESTRATSVAISLLWQLLQYEIVDAHPEFDAVLRRFQPFLNAYPDVNQCPLHRLLYLLDICLPLVGEVLVVVDALNECATSTEAVILRNYLFKISRTPSTKIIVSAQDKCSLQSGNDTLSHIHLNQLMIEPDILHFLERMIRGKDKFFAKGAEIVETIAARSQGIFLHATLLFNYIDTAQSVNEQVAKMERFGDQVSDEYERQFLENDAKLSDAQRLRRDNYYRVLLAARKSMTAQNVSEILACNDLLGTVDRNDLNFEPANDVTRLCFPLVEVMGNSHVVFIHGSVKEFLLRQHLTSPESDLYLTRKCLAALREERYQTSLIPSRLLRRHLLEGTLYITDGVEDGEKHSALYDYATLYWQDHVTELKNPPDDVIQNLATFLQGIEFVSYSEHLLDLTKRSSLSNQISVYGKLLKWAQDLPAAIKARVPLEEYFEKAHVVLSAAVSEEGRDKILQYLPLVRNGDYLNSGGQSSCAWLKAYNYKKRVVDGFSNMLGEDSPVTLRSSASLLQEYFWQKRFDEVLPRLLAVAKAQRQLGSAGEQDLYTTLWALGIAYHCLTKLDEAIDIFAEAAEGVARGLGKSNCQYLLISLYEGHTLEQLLRFPDALVLYEHVKQTLTPILGSDNGFTLMSQTAIGAVQRKQKHYDEGRVNLEEGWLGRKKKFSIDVNVCADAAVQLALLYRDNMQGVRCIEVLDSVSGSSVYKEDFERRCQIEHIRALVAFDSGNFEPKLALLRLLHQASGSERSSNNRELMWVRETLAQVIRYQGEDDLALGLFFDIVRTTDENSGELSNEPEPPSQLRIAEKAVHLVREARLSDAQQLLHENGLQWVREADFYILGEGGPIADTAVISPINFPTA